MSCPVMGNHDIVRLFNFYTPVFDFNIISIFHGNFSTSRFNFTGGCASLNGYACSPATSELNGFGASGNFYFHLVLLGIFVVITEGNTRMGTCNDKHHCHYDK